MDGSAVNLLHSLRWSERRYRKKINESFLAFIFEFIGFYFFLFPYYHKTWKKTKKVDEKRVYCRQNLKMVDA